MILEVCGGVCVSSVCIFLIYLFIYFFYCYSWDVSGLQLLASGVLSASEAREAPLSYHVLTQKQLANVAIAILTAMYSNSTDY